MTLFSRSALRLSLVAVVSAVFLCGAHAAPAKSGKCFHTSNINGWTYVDKDTVRVSVGPSRAFDLKVMGTAQELNFHERLGIKSSPTEWVCEGNGLGLEIFSGGPVPRTWQIINVKAVPKAKP